MAGGRKARMTQGPSSRRKPVIERRCVSCPRAVLLFSPSRMGRAAQEIDRYTFMYTFPCMYMFSCYMYTNICLGVQNLSLALGLATNLLENRSLRLPKRSS